MKKAFFAALAALMALAFVGCPVGPGGTEPVEYTADGRPLVNLTINSKLSRALTAELAKAGADYYEVVFKNGSNYYKAAWDWGKTGRIKVEPGTYAAAGAAVLFAGSYLDNTLLAVGTITTPGGGVIAATTTSITFTMSPLTSDVKADATNSTFKITAPSTHLTTAVSGTFPTARLNGQDIPIFNVPRGVTTTTADFAIGGINSHLAGIYYLGGGAVASKGISGYSSTGEDKPVELVSGANTKVSVPAAAGVLASATITFALETPAKDGLSRLAFALPVCAIDPAAKGLTWYIRGGMENGVLDAGATANSVGGAILLGVGTVSSTAIDIVW